MELNLAKAALVIIDLQKGVANLQTAPYPAAEVVRNSVKLAASFHSAGAFVVAVNVDFADGMDALKPITDQAPSSVAGSRPADWSKLVPEIDAVKSIQITKRQWGAFYGTDLDLQLRRRGINTIVLCGISTSIGVDTTAREAYQHGYQQIFAEDAMAALSEEEHRYTVATIFPRMGRIRKTMQILQLLHEG